METEGFIIGGGRWRAGDLKVFKKTLFSFASKPFTQSHSVSNSPASSVTSVSRPEYHQLGVHRAVPAEWVYQPT